MSKMQRDKGIRFELELVKIAEQHELKAKRVPLSGSMQGFKSDVIIHSKTGDWSIEAKKRGNGFKFLYDNLEKDDADALVVAADRKKPLAILHYSDFLDLINGKLIVGQSNES
tara:strand:- start:168 stop:506 length:339 start_codon:yes stop_codon:yes gene_type:complete